MSSLAILTKPALESILFAATAPVDPSDLAAAFALDESTVVDMVTELAREYLGRDAGLEIREQSGGYRIYTKAEFAPAVGRYANRAKLGRLSKAAVETLSIITYTQPVTRGEIARIRGVNVDSSLRTLVERGLVDEVGIEPTPGRPTTFGTTPLFLEKLGLANLEELPKLADLAPNAEAAAEIERALSPRPVQLELEDD